MFLKKGTQENGEKRTKSGTFEITVYLSHNMFMLMDANIRMSPPLQVMTYNIK